MDVGTSWHSYPSIYNVGHRCLEPMVGRAVLMEEKVDGSQFSFGRFGGVLRVRSKGQEMLPDAPEQMFKRAVEAVAGLDLHDGWTYRGEYLAKPKHNTLAYSRVPEKHVIIFDINPAEEAYLPYEQKQAEATRLGLECVPCLGVGVPTADRLRALLQKESVLGGTTIEGVVLKAYDLFGPDKKVLMGKFVSEAFKERHTTEWKKTNPQAGDIVDALIAELRTEARWLKTIQHLRDDGRLEHDPRDIPALLKEISSDTHREEADAIKDQLFKWAWPKISRALTRGFPEFYKQWLLDQQLADNPLD